jgi:hypothetical protein
MILLFLIWICYILCEAYREGYYWHYKSFVVDNRKFNIHIIFTIQRFLMLTSLTFVKFEYFSVNNLDLLLFFVSCCLIFSFIHNGMYYTIRNMLNNNIYKKKWFDQSSTSTALTTKFFTPVSRTIMFGIGISLMIYLSI